MSQSIRILEYTRITKAREVDEEKCVLRDLVLLGPSSANGRDYPESTQRAMLPLLEGRQSFADHSRAGEPSIYHLLGVWQECRVEGGKVRGNFHYFKSHKLAPMLVEAAKRPELNNALGFSINARGRTTARNGRDVVEGIDEVISIDCVAQPATVAGLYESRRPVVRLALRELIESLKASRPGYARALREVAEAGVLGPDAAMDVPPDEPAPDEGKDHKQALMDALKALCDEAESLDEGEWKKKMMAIYKLIKGESGGGGSDAPATEESRRLKAENGQLLAEKLVRKAAQAAGVALSESLVEALARPGMTEAQAAGVVNELKGGGGGSQKPRSAAPFVPPASPQGGKGVQESKETVPADSKSRAAWLRGD